MLCRVEIDYMQLILVAIVPLVAISLISVIAMQFQWRHFYQPVMATGAKRRLQWPLWIWIPLVAVVGLDGWRIREGDSNRQELLRERDAAVYAEMKASWEELINKARTGYVPQEFEIDWYFFRPQILIATLPAALADESEPVQKLALRICQPDTNQNWAVHSKSPTPWHKSCSAVEKATLLQALRTYEQNPDRPANLRAEAKTAADWLATLIHLRHP